MLSDLDLIDKKILTALQRNGRLLNNELAREVGLSPSPCLRRVKNLEDRGVIQKYVAIIDPAAVGANITLFPRVWLRSQDAETIDQFLDVIQGLSQVLDCYIMLGDCDAMLRVVMADLDEYRHFQIRHLNRANGVERVKTELPSQVVKQSYALPVA